MFQRIAQFGLITSTGFALIAAVASCDGADAGFPGSGGSAALGGSPPTTTGGSLGSGGAAALGGTATSGGGATSVAGASSSGGSSATAGTGSSGGANTSGGTSSQPVCTNMQHPDHPSEPCSIWPEWDATKGAGEPKDCDASWLTGAGFCLESCGKCQSSGGSGGSGSGGTGSGTAGTTGLGPGPDLPTISNGTVHWASRYWDCCKPHCAGQGLPSCGSDGVSSDNGQSACAGGSAYACYNEAPRAIGDNVSYGYVAVPNPSCGTCYHLQFTGTGQHNQSDPGSQLIRDKHMIVKVTNTGGDVAGNQFDLMIPGGGVGLNPNTCPQQWNVSSGDLGPPPGGFLAACSGPHVTKKECVRQKCDLLPAGDLRDGCFWFVDWYQVADNPNFRYEQIDCPSDI